jgi:hypothetical protein
LESSADGGSMGIPNESRGAVESACTCVTCTPPPCATAADSEREGEAPPPPAPPAALLRQGMDCDFLRGLRRERKWVVEEGGSGMSEVAVDAVSSESESDSDSDMFLDASPGASEAGLGAVVDGGSTGSRDFMFPDANLKMACR